MRSSFVRSMSGSEWDAKMLFSSSVSVSSSCRHKFYLDDFTMP